MPKIERKNQSVFGGSLVAQDNIAKFGSLKAGAADYSLDPDAIQTSAYLNGWAAATVNNNAPCVQDMNALFYLATRQLAYMIQTGVPEWNSTTTYYIGSVVNDGTGKLYKCKVDGTVGTILSNTTSWAEIAPGITAPVLAAGGSTGTIDCTLGSVFYHSGFGYAAKTLTVNNMADGQTINVKVGNASANYTTQVSANTVTRTLHGLANGTRVKFLTLANTTGIAVETVYYVINTASNTFQLSITSGGSAIDLTGTDGNGQLLPLCDVTWVLSDGTQRTGPSYSGTVTSTMSLFTLTRIGSDIIINSLNAIY